MLFSPSVTSPPHFFFLLNENDIWPGKEERDSFLFVPFPSLKSPENLTAFLLLFLEHNVFTSYAKGQTVCFHTKS